MNAMPDFCVERALFRTGAVLRRSNTRPGRRATFQLHDAASSGRPTTFVVRPRKPANQADGAAWTSALRAFGVQDVRRLIRTVRRLCNSLTILLQMSDKPTSIHG